MEGNTRTNYETVNQIKKAKSSARLMALVLTRVPVTQARAAPHGSLDRYMRPLYTQPTDPYPYATPSRRRRCLSLRCGGV